MSTALLTGVGRKGQVGEAVAERLGRDGYTLILVDRDEKAVEERAGEMRQLGLEAVAIAADLSSPESVGHLFDEVRKQTKSLEAVVNLAGGFAATGPVADMDVADWDKQLTINLRTAFLTSRGAIPLLRAGKGSLVFFSSESALPGAKLARTSAYAVAKAGVLTLASAISQEESSNGVRANVLAPGAIRTAANTADMKPGTPFVDREEVAAAVAWLCSGEASAVTGQVIRLSPH